MNLGVTLLVLTFWQICYEIECVDPLPEVVNVGYLYLPSVDGPNGSPFATIKTAELKLKENGVLPDYVTFDVKWAPTVCDEYNGTIEFIRLKEDHNIDVFLGPPCSQSADMIGEIAVPYNLLCISHRTDDFIFTNTALYQTYARTTRKDINQIAGGLDKFLVLNNWHSVAIMTPADDFYANLIREGVKFMFINAPKIKLSNRLIEVAVDIKYEQNNLDLSKHLERIKKSARIVIAIMGVAMEGSSNLMLQAHRANMTGPEWVWLFIDLSAKLVNLRPWETYDERGVVVDREEIKEAYRAALTIDVMERDTEAHTRFVNAIRSAYSSLNPTRPITDYEFTDSNVALFDATYSYGTLLNASVENGIKYNDGKGLFNLFAWRYIEIGADAEALKIDGVMDLAPLYSIEAFNRNNKWEVIWSVDRFRNESPIHYDYTIEMTSTNFIWRTTDNKPPLAIPICGFDASKCIEDTSLPVWVWVLICLAIALVLCLMIFLYRRKMEELELQNKNWLLNNTKIVENNNNRVMSRASDTRSILSDSNASISQNKHTSYLNGLLTGTYDGQDCYIFKYVTTKEVNWRNEQLKTLKNIKTLNHENLSYFFGVSVVSRDELLILWSRTPQKTLRDVLENRDMPLDDDFLASFLRGAVSGLKFVHHSGTLVHGHLTSETCTIDSRFVLKLSEFGMAPLLCPLAEDAVIKLEREPYALYHCAPEILADAARGVSPGSKPADVYALGMIYYQIISRKSLFFEYDGTEEALLSRIQDSQRLPLRPTFGDDMPLTWMAIIGLTKNCWAHEPLARPTVDMVYSSVSTATSQFKGNIIEKMIHRMERYTNDLEKVINERTQEVHAQQERTEKLLQQMLPKSVAEKLQAGIAVDPEYYDSATVMFTHIVKFSDLSSNRTAVEIVALLNQIYSSFDDLIDKRDVYKVETIGDSYMVVSGIPVRTPNHAVEIALLGISLRDYVRGYDMPFIEEEPLQITLGAHTGPIATGVIGRKMPRFCLFGDSVNMASRIETNGIPMRFHISESTKKALEGNNNFEIALRGQIEIKGKGTQTTFFVDKKRQKPVLD